MSNLFNEVLYKTDTFSEIWSSVDSFLEDYNELDDSLKVLSEDTVKVTYFLLFANYGSSHINSNFLMQWKYKLFTLMYQYAPIWSKKMELQEALRSIALDSDEILKSGKVIYNSAQNDGGAPSTTSLEELTYINNQNVSSYLKSKVDAYDRLYSMIASDITKEYINRFRTLFISVLTSTGDTFITGDKEDMENMTNNFILWWW